MKSCVICFCLFLLFHLANTLQFHPCYHTASFHSFVCLSNISFHSLSSPTFVFIIFLIIAIWEVLDGMPLWFLFTFPWWVELKFFSYVFAHLYFFFGKMSNQLLCPFLLLECFLFWCWVLWIIYIYIYGINSSLDMSFANIFWFFILLSVSFGPQILFNLM